MSERSARLATSRVLERDRVGSNGPVRLAGLGLCIWAVAVLSWGGHAEAAGAGPQVCTFRLGEDQAAPERWVRDAAVEADELPPTIVLPADYGPGPLPAFDRTTLEFGCDMILTDQRGTAERTVYFVVNAPDGPMPRTRAAMALAARLGLEASGVLMTNTDLVDDPELLVLIAIELEELAEAHGLELPEAAIFRCAATCTALAGQGL